MRGSSTAAALAVLLLALSGCSGSSATDEDKLANVRGKGFGVTPPLYPERPWAVSYSWDCAKQLGEGRAVLQQVRLNVKHADDGSDVEKGALVQRKGKKGTGVLKYPRPGAYLVIITTECDFRLRVDQQKGST